MRRAACDIQPHAPCTVAASQSVAKVAWRRWRSYVATAASGPCASALATQRQRRQAPHPLCGGAQRVSEPRGRERWKALAAERARLRLPAVPVVRHVLRRVGLRPPGAPLRRARVVVAPLQRRRQCHVAPELPAKHGRRPGVQPRHAAARRRRTRAGSGGARVSRPVRSYRTDVLTASRNKPLKLCCSTQTGRLHELIYR